MQPPAQELCKGGSLRDKVLAQMGSWHKVRVSQLGFAHKLLLCLFLWLPDSELHGEQ